ncbi:hypothetical protein FQZ97_876130 [compost metagenome]
MAPGLILDAGHGRGDHVVDATTAQGQVHLHHRHVDRDGPQQPGDAHRGRVVGAHAGALEVGRRGHRLAGVQPLRGPGHGVQRFQALLREMALDQRALEHPQALRIGIAAHHERDRVGARDRNVFGHAGHDGFARLQPALLHRLRNVRQLDQRIVRMHRHPESAAREPLHVAGEPHDVGRVERVLAITRGQGPAGLGLRSRCREPRGDPEQLHGGSPGGRDGRWRGAQDCIWRGSHSTTSGTK